MSDSGTTWKAMRPDQPRVCAGCGKRIVLKHGSLMFITSDPPSSWHVECKRAYELTFTDEDRERWAAYREHKAEQRKRRTGSVHRYA